MKKRETSLFSEPMPSQITDEYWLYAERKRGQYPKATAKSGKWLVFVPVSQVDEVWAKIREATEDGRLGDSAKVATAKPNPNASDPSKKVICVYTYDWTNEEDVWRIRDELRVLGITSKIPYKTDRDTTAGRYAKRGHQRISTMNSLRLVSQANRSLHGEGVEISTLRRVAKALGQRVRIDLA